MHGYMCVCVWVGDRNKGGLENLNNLKTKKDVAHSV